MRVGMFLRQSTGLGQVSVTPPLSVPTAPSSLQVTGQTDTTMDLQWQDNSSNEDGFTLLYRPNDNNWGVGDLGPVAIPADSTTYTVPGLSPNTLYYFQLVAQNGAGSSSPVETSGTTNAAMGGGGLDRVYVAGGRPASGDYYSTVEFMQIASGGWFSTAFTTEPVIGAAAVSNDNDALVAGGQTSTPTFPTVIKRHNFAANTYTSLGTALSNARSQFSGGGNQTYFNLYGGYTGVLPANNVTSGNWSTLALTSGPNLSPARQGAACISNTESAWLWGGYSNVLKVEPHIHSSGAESPGFVALSSQRYWLGGASNATNGYVFGGWTGTVGVDEVTRFPWATNTPAIVGVSLPTVDKQQTYVAGNETRAIMGQSTSSKFTYSTETFGGLQTFVSGTRLYAAAYADIPGGI